VLYQPEVAYGLADKPRDSLEHKVSHGFPDLSIDLTRISLILSYYQIEAYHTGSLPNASPHHTEAMPVQVQANSNRHTYEVAAKH
jgi:hypothetical protein